MIDLSERLDFKDYFEKDDNFSLDYIVTNIIGENYPMVLNNHINSEIYVCYEGEGLFGVDGTKTQISKGDIMLVNPFANHGHSSKTKLSMHIIGFSKIRFEIDGSDTLVAHSDIDTINEIIETMKNIGKRKRYRDTKVMQGLASSLLNVVLAETTVHSSNYIIGKGSFLTNKVADYISNNFKADISLDSLSNMFHCSKSTLAHSFKKDYGTTVMDFLRERRLKEILFWLEISDRPINELASDHHFETMPYFYKYFQRKIGMTPSKYRAMKKAEKNKEKN